MNAKERRREYGEYLKREEKKVLSCRTCPHESGCVETAAKQKTFTPPPYCPRLAEPSNTRRCGGSERMDEINRQLIMVDLSPEAREHLRDCDRRATQKEIE